jgi:hypothetical protein
MQLAERKQVREFLLDHNDDWALICRYFAEKSQLAILQLCRSDQDDERNRGRIEVYGQIIGLYQCLRDQIHRENAEGGQQDVELDVGKE